MHPFVAWNLRLLQAFFSPASRGEEVWIAVDPEELDLIGQDLDGDQGFLAAVREGPPWATLWTDASRSYYGRGTCEDFTRRALGLRRQREFSLSRPREYVDPGELAPDYAGADAPAYLPYLAALIRCAALRGDEGGFYDGLRASLGLRDNWYTGEMRELEPLWLDLQRWSASRGSPFGYFRHRQLGGYRYIGVPTSQSIVSRRDLRELTRIFAQTGVRPGQRIDGALIEDVRALAAGSPHLSAPFIRALNSTEFSEPVRERLRALLEDWDGTVAVQHGGSSSAGSIGVAAGPQEERSEVLLELGLSAGSLPWRINWRIPALRDSGNVTLSREGVSWFARFAGTEAVTTRPSADDRLAVDFASHLLARSEQQDVHFDVAVADTEQGSPQRAGGLLLRKSILRTLVAVREVDEEDRHHIVLRERPLPSFRGAYLLAAPGNVDRLERWLSVNRVEHTRCEATGLPDGWILDYLEDCASIGEDARSQLPDGAMERAQARVIRFIGGRSVQRAGLRQYLSYDLPVIELDAPDGTTLEAEGLHLVERTPARPPGTEEQVWEGPIKQASGLRHFVIELASSGKSFMVRARGPGVDGCEARLRLAPDSGLAVSHGKDFRLDSRGDPTTSPEGLLGVLWSAAARDPLRVAPTRRNGVDMRRAVALGEELSTHDIEQILRQPTVRFLDSLAQAGSMAYGVARDQIRRLGGFAGDANPAAVLSSLRGRGFLEIETDPKGRWTRVHAAPPTMAVIPHVHHKGHVVAAPTGTLRLQHWRELLSGRSGGCIPFSSSLRGDGVLPPVWVAAHEMSGLIRLAEGCGVGVAEQPALEIATWSASLTDVEAGFRGTGIESLGTSERAVERFFPPTGLFSPSARGAYLDSNFSCQLFRLEDAETGHHQVYSLGHRDAAGATRFSFVRDSRWGVWLALSAFSEFARSTFGISDASPWPFHLDARDGTFWLPARINLPVVLERALRLCSGAPPLQVQVHGTTDEGMRVLIERHTRRTIGGVSLVYDQMVPSAPGWSTWLGYRWVSREVADLVAARLGGQVLPLQRP